VHKNTRKISGTPYISKPPKYLLVAPQVNLVIFSSTYNYQL